jgi:hypothetical protein
MVIAETEARRKKSKQLSHGVRKAAESMFHLATSI